MNANLTFTIRQIGEVDFEGVDGDTEVVNGAILEGDIEAVRSLGRFFGEPVTIFSVRSDEVARLKTEVARYRKALSEILGYDRNFYDNGRPGYEAIARAALADDAEGCS